MKPTDKPLKSTKKRTTHPRGRAALYREMKLGTEIMAKIKDTSLDSAGEQNELIMLNRGAEPGTMTPIVQRLVDDAAAGKKVSALAEGAKLNKRVKQKPSLQAAWTKRMIFAWELATYEEAEAFIETLIESLKAKGTCHERSESSQLGS